ncbi:MAG: Lrp/AsnC family transcriptional regulator [Nanoarchaeota archaeon]
MPFSQVLDSTDKKILYELNWNARQSNNSIAKKLRISKQVTNYRIKRMEKDGIISSYHAVIDWRRLGYNALRVYIKWNNITLEEEAKIHEHIRKDPLFMWSIKFGGEIDLGFYVWIKDIPSFSKQWQEFITKYKQFIQKYEIYESVEMIHYPMKFLWPEKKNTEELTIGQENFIDYDDKDYQILKAITINGRIPILELSTKIRLTPKSIINRIKNLEKKKIIVGYYTLINSELIGYHFYKVDFYLNNLKNIKLMNDHAKNHNNIVYRMNTIGGPDFEIEVMVENVDALEKIITEIRKNFAKDINYYRTHRLEKTIKQVYLPGESTI